LHYVRKIKEYRTEIIGNSNFTDSGVLGDDPAIGRWIKWCINILLCCNAWRTRI